MAFPHAARLNDRERFFFDLNGFIVLRGVVAPKLVQACNDILDTLQHCPGGSWQGRVHAHSYGGADGVNLQQIYEAGPPFEELLDHPSWIGKVLELIGSEHNFDALHGPLYIDEAFASLRGPGEAIGLHSGGQEGCIRCQYRYLDGHFHCGQVNALMALRDIGPGDGATMVVPGSHKSHFPHPDLERHRMVAGQAPAVDGLEGAVEVYLQAGDVLLFVDAIMHGSARRVNSGQRRLVIYRYGPSWGRSRHGYRPSAALLQRLSPERRQLIDPGQALLPPEESA